MQSLYLTDILFVETVVWQMALTGGTVRIRKAVSTHSTI